MLKIHGTREASSVSGKWTWNAKTEKLVFQPYHDLEKVHEQTKKTNGFIFRQSITQEEELIFRQEFERSKTSFDADVIIISDIRNLVLFLMPSEMIYRMFIEFMHTKEVMNFLHALIIYFEYHLKYVEFLLIRRDETAGPAAKIQSGESVKMKRTFANYLSQYRLLLAREFSIILLGQGDMAKYYHMKPVVNISATIRDKSFHEHFLAVSTQIVWIAMHRRGYEIINSEMSRLFRSDYYKCNRTEPVRYTTVDKRMLVGPKSINKNYRYQNSPVMQELFCVHLEDQPILWIGERIYRGTSERIHKLELEYIVPDSQLSLIDVTHGILGHPKKLYNTLLKLSWHAVRFEKYSESNDPYRLIRQPDFSLPNINEEKMHECAVHLTHFYSLIKHHESPARATIEKWLKRDSLEHYFKSKGIITDIWMRCEQEVAKEVTSLNIQKITERFQEEKVKLRKLKKKKMKKKG